ncbi:hypothetical protein PMZ80_003620 [Knufia obscura]|uniref:Uncharacterized protein n=2 Tax=Knufia TaxID=430999 RepID=A0AAN8EQ29_9EURO|nr:hypothetical protein PMZ80_003620 [Knufia obscura]KAK5958465.1 hypothetical protein OHC33_000308 [Knufia fluminis]
MCMKKQTMKSDSASMLSTSTTSSIAQLKDMLHKQAAKASKSSPKAKPSPEQIAKENQIKAEARVAYFSLR